MTTFEKYKRERERRTNYKKRLAILKSGKTRLVVRKSLKNIVAQLIEFHPEGDKTVLAVSSRELLKHGWKASKSNIPAAYLTGLLLGKKAQEKKIKQAVLDIGMQPCVKWSRIFAVVKGAVDAGLDIPHSDEVLPKEDRISGKHISDYAVLLKKDKKGYEKQFSHYLKEKINPEDLAKHFEDVRRKILK